MTMIVVGGHSRKVGKTSVAAGLIAAFPEYPWTAIKFSSHLHGYSGCTSAVHEETNCHGDSDSCRFLAAGASRSFWMSVGAGGIKEAVGRLTEVLQASPFLMVESNSILNCLAPDLYLMVLDYEVQDFKESARQTLSRANAIVALHRKSLHPWEGISSEMLARIPIFDTDELANIPSKVLDMVRNVVVRGNG